MIIDGGLRPIFRKNLPRFHWTSIETGFTSAGVPDAEFCYSGVQGWIEYKATSSLRIKVNTKVAAFQIAWHERRARAGGRSFLAVRRIEDIYLYWGKDVRKVYTIGLSIDPVLHFFGGPGNWDWEAIGGLLAIGDK